MFALGTITQVLGTVTRIQEASTHITYYYIRDGTSLLMVRLWDAFLSSTFNLINGCSVYYMRFDLRLAHGDYLEQRQACHCHSCVLHPCLHRYIKVVSQDCRSVLIWNYRSQVLPGGPSLTC
jgi:hypothetical protein